MMATNSGDPGGDAEMLDDTLEKSKCTPSETTSENSNPEDGSKLTTGSKTESTNQQSENTNSETKNGSEPPDTTVDVTTENSSKEDENSKETAMDVSAGAELTRVSSDEPAEAAEAAEPKETVDFKVVFNKQKHDVSFDLDGTVSSLKIHLQTTTGVPSGMQKLMYRGLMKDDKTLRDLKVTKGVKLMLIGSTINDVLEVNKPVAKGTTKEKDEAGAPAKEALSKQKMHKKVLDKGKPEDIMPGIKGRKDALPSVPISGMYNKAGGKVRLTFKLEIDQLWIGTKERTEKLPMSSIKNVISEPIEGHEQYHIMAIQLGPTEQSRYWLYWVPAQYTHAIKDAILFKWQYF
ncbi:ubiquitin domain-containing protein UBFD1-like [Asterias rubens]|uniref:ubiquitin domain-containing protein UBFD1-like n=1 Tax=Asterias rubens TaxID=7604 RepID=UPI0014559A4A|nr:ubiquitin domain-containing protein UBFD1-like [Asterias rubens]